MSVDMFDISEGEFGSSAVKTDWACEVEPANEEMGGGTFLNPRM